ncbi:TolC family protein [uncultured Bacteroides sp.]|uniref:TolC family protein n=1 Tax=uncultured Bacteroides sp. TaxID=162156 RepID=UPI002AAABF7B|nr:TolC family protein [uncultured Bacteroides sp.]
MAKQIFKTAFLVLAALTGYHAKIQAQENTDSLSLQEIMQEVINNHPSVKDAEETLNRANAHIKLAQASYLPTADLNASYTRLGPSSKVSLPSLGTFQLNPYDNYRAEVDINQTIYDFQKTSKNVRVEKKKKEIDEVSIEQIKKSLSTTVMNNYYALVYLQNAIDIKNEELENLQDHLKSIQKKKSTGSATKYEILTTQVKISTIESQKYDLIANIKNQLSTLNTLLGLPEETPHKVKGISYLGNMNMSENPVTYAMEHREEMKKARKQTELEKLNYSAIKASNNPSINAFASAGYKNGYSPDLKELRGNFAVGVGIKIPLFDAKKTKNNLLISKSNLTSSKYETEIIRRNITNEVIEAESGVEASKKKVIQFKLQLSQATQAYELAKISFKTGAITNLDLLDSETTVSESRLQLLKSTLDYQVCLLKLNIAVGNHIY